MRTFEPETRKLFAESGQSTLKALLAMNGGSVAAFLAFLTPLVQGGAVRVEFLSALRCFVFGLVATVFGFATIHISLLASGLGFDRWPGVFYVVTVLLCFIAAGLFLTGVFVAMGAVSA